MDQILPEYRLESRDVASKPAVLFGLSLLPATFFATFASIDCVRRDARR